MVAAIQPFLQPIPFWMERLGPRDPHANASEVAGFFFQTRGEGGHVFRTV
mgnify:FL=1